LKIADARSLSFKIAQFQAHIPVLATNAVADAIMAMKAKSVLNILAVVMMAMALECAVLPCLITSIAVWKRRSSKAKKRRASRGVKNRGIRGLFLVGQKKTSPTVAKATMEHDDVQVAEG
jgi:hypothetical protein